MAVVSMSKQEFSRLDVLLRVQSGRLRVSDACVLIGLQRRQVFRLLRGLFAGRMASNTATGASSRTRGSQAGAWCSGTCCIWARPTTRRNWRGGGRSRWRRTAQRPRTLSLFPEDRCEGLLADASIVGVRLSELRLRRPRQWGACWLALVLWRELQLDQFWSKRLGVSRKGTRWDQVLFVLVAYRRWATDRCSL